MQSTVALMPSHLNQLISSSHSEAPSSVHGHLFGTSLFDCFLRTCPCRDASSDFHSDFLLTVAQHVTPNRFHVLKKRVPINRLKTDQILQHFYDINHVIDFGEGVYVGLDIIIDPIKNDFARKVSNAYRLTRLRANIGIEHFFFVLMIGYSNKPNIEFVQNFKPTLLDSFTQALNEDFQRVHNFRLYFS